jgi:hypothetical protein
MVIVLNIQVFTMKKDEIAANITRINYSYFNYKKNFFLLLIPKYMMHHFRYIL